jgi:hypothetical protein
MQRWASNLSLHNGKSTSNFNTDISVSSGSAAGAQVVGGWIGVDCSAACH